MVHNEVTASCCGRPASECSCRQSVPLPGYTANAGVQKPTPMPQPPVWNFDEEESEPKKDSPRKAVKNSSQRFTASGAPIPQVPLGLPSMTFEDGKY